MSARRRSAYRRGVRGCAALAISGALMIAAQPAARAQSGAGAFEVGGQLATAGSSQFDLTDVGAGGRFAWHPANTVGVEAEVDFYPRDFPERTAFTQGRTEGLFGVTLGPRFGRFRPFGKVRPGFLTYEAAPGPIACITIFPPPLSCELAAGRSLFALDLGGGLEVAVTQHTLVRVDVGDWLVRYPGPSFDGDRNVRTSDFFGHEFRVTFGAGLRF